jgi:hypothetical protein
MPAGPKDSTKKVFPLAQTHPDCYATMQAQYFESVRHFNSTTSYFLLPAVMMRLFVRDAEIDEPDAANPAL